MEWENGRCGKAGEVADDEDCRTGRGMDVTRIGNFDVTDATEAKKL
jgi:hypothetical protein